MDKSWMKIRNRAHPDYMEGVKQFLDFAFIHTTLGDRISCPCKNCNNCVLKTRDDVEADLLIFGIVPSYTRWNMHGQSIQESQDDSLDNDDESDVEEMHEMLQDHFGTLNTEGWVARDSSGDGFEEPNEEAAKFFRLLRDQEQNLYPGCDKFSKLSFTMKLFHIKCLGGWSNKTFTMLLGLLREAFPTGIELPKTYYEARKTIQDLGLDYIKIDACEKDCMLFWKENANRDECVVCGESRWKSDEGNARGKKIPKKVLRYFPLTPRLKRLFMSTKIASNMTWHHDKRIDDGLLRHPADSEAWKTFDELHNWFALEPRNVRLGLASDGFNPFGNMSSSHSTWPVVLVPYNLPPWLCMKKSHMMLSLLIPGPNQLGNEIDVYLQPLIEELRELWEVGVETYDSSKKQNFKMHAAVLWTINDFPAYGNLSGWSTKGALACPSCAKETSSFYLKNGGKTCFLGHRRFLPIKHRWRLQGRLFDGRKETRNPPKQLSGDDVIDQVRHLDGIILGKSSKKRKRNKLDNWLKKSIFFDLPYWKTLLLRHNLDVMHIEKNACDSVIGTLMNITGKSKDHLKCRLDLKNMGIREELHPIQVHENKAVLPPACYTLSIEEKRILCEFLKDLKVPDSYSSNISRRVNLKECKISGLKSHDLHVLLETVLPLALRGLLQKKVCDPLIELSNFFKALCSRVLNVDDLDRMESQIVTTLCKLEMIFPPSFFDIMMHLPVHLAGEAKIAGPVQYRWMYPIERYLRTLKAYVRNRARPEGSIAEGYIADECVTFCSRYFRRIETRFNRVGRNWDGGQAQSHEGLAIFAQAGCPIQRGKETCNLSLEEWMQAHLYVLKNCDEVLPFIDEHRHEIQQSNSFRNIDDIHQQKFPEWFERRVTRLYNEGSDQISRQLLDLARGPDQIVSRYNGYKINGFIFHTKECDSRRKTQNSGVIVKGNGLDYYGVLTDIIELQYMGGNKIVIFKCVWWDVDNQGRGINTDEYGVTSVNTTRTLKTNEPFVLACQSEQVFYVKDIRNTNWNFVLKTEPRDYYNIPSKAEGEEEKEQEEEEEENEETIPEPYQHNASFGHQMSTNTLEDDDDDMVVWDRVDIPGIVVDVNMQDISGDAAFTDDGED